MVLNLKRIRWAEHVASVGDLKIFLQGFSRKHTHARTQGKYHWSEIRLRGRVVLKLSSKKKAVISKAD